MTPLAKLSNHKSRPACLQLKTFHVRRAFVYLLIYGILALSLACWLSLFDQKHIRFAFLDIWSTTGAPGTNDFVDLPPMLASSTGTSAPRNLFSKLLLPKDKDQLQAVYGRLGSVVQNESKCLELLSIPRHQETVIDLSCTKPWRNTFYHRLVDCFVPSLSALTYAITQPKSLTATTATSATTTIITPPYLSEIYRYFLSKSGNYTFLEYEERKRPSFCLVLPPHPVKIVYPDWAIPREEQGYHLEKIRSLVEKVPYEASSLEPSSLNSTPQSYVTLIHRSCRHHRCFRNAEKILESFTTRLNMSGRMYYGNESVHDTIHTFFTSKVVVGFHGAGFANTIFCKRGSIVLEYTTFRDMDGTKMWRSNENALKAHGGLTWITHTIDIDHIANLTVLVNQTDVDHYIKSLNHIDVTGSDLFTSIERVKRELRQDLSARDDRDSEKGRI